MQLGALSILGHVISHVMSTLCPDEEKMDPSDRQSISKELVHSSLLLLCKLSTKFIRTYL